MERKVSVVVGIRWLTLMALMFAGVPTVEAQQQARTENEIAPAEDLMREHGVLRRIFLVYEEIIRRVDNGQDIPVDTVRMSADIVHTFIEEYHEKLEETYIFPSFEKSKKYSELAKTLLTQHNAGRRLTDEILKLADKNDYNSRTKMTYDMRLFLREYRPHAAREDTVLFPALHTALSKKEYDKLGKIFEDREHELFGASGFEGMVQKTSEIEELLGIHDLNQFTPSFP
jgi:hemerythrin-like domain-containing protein